MIISRLSDYLRAHRRASLLDMAMALDTDPSALRDMLAMLERKGRACKLPGGTACASGCTQCQPHTIELYEWTGPQLPAVQARTTIPIRLCASA